MKKIKVKCKACGVDFDAKRVELKEKCIGAMRTETYMNCPYCDKKYLICINTAKARKLMAEIQKNINAGNEEKTEKLKKELKIEMDRSNGRST